MPRLRIHPGRPDEIVHELSPGTLIIGRDPDCDVSIPKRSLSRHHARLELRPDGGTLTDLSSKNGTFVDGTRITTSDLCGGERLRFGHVDSRFELDSTDSDAPSGPTPLRSRTGVALRPVTALLSPGGGAAEMVLGLRTLASPDRLCLLLQILLDFGDRLLTASTTERVCDETLGIVFESLGVERVVILLDDGGPQELTPRAVRAAPGLAQADLTHVRKLADYVLQKTATVLFPDTGTQQSDKSWAPTHGQQVRSSMVAPLTSSLRIHGVMYVDRVTAAPFTPEDLELFASLSNQTASALRAVELRDKSSC